MRKITFLALSTGLAWSCIFGFDVVEKRYASAQTQPNLPRERVFDRVALALTGSLAHPELKASYVGGTKNISEVVQTLTKTDQFLYTTARFWLAKMKISGITDFENITTTGNRTVMQSMTPENRTERSRTLEWKLSGAVTGGGYFRLSSDFEGTLQGVADDLTLVRQIQNKSQVDCELGTPREFIRNGGRICPGPFNKFDPNLTTTTAIQKSTCTIPALTSAEINANVVNGLWFAPPGSTETRVCPGVKERCGARLQNCFPGELIQGNINTYNGPLNSLIPNLRRDFTTEPGMIAAMVIRDARPWEDVLRTSEAPMTGALESFLASAWGSRILENMPSGSYRKDGELILDATRNVNDRNWVWRDRGPLHAGVLTTIAFQKAFNGWRAKSASSLDAFLCRVFAVPEGVAVLPSAEVDLTRKPYCQSCHSVLEPLSLFFGRWPNLGNNNFIYNPGADRVATGSFENMTNADTNGLAKVYTSTKDFHDCGVARAFELMVGRSMNQQELISAMPALQKVYRDGGNQILPVLQAIAAGPLFERSRQ